jgi:hypothetical protein
VEIAEAAANCKSVLPELRGPAWTNKKRYIAARQQQTSAEIATDCAGSDNENFSFRPILHYQGIRQPSAGRNPWPFALKLAISFGR